MAQSVNEATLHGAADPSLDLCFCGCTFHIMSNVHRVRLGSEKPSENMSRAAFGVLYNSKELQFVVAQRWWSMCSCGGRVVECE